MASSIITCNHSGLADADLLLNYALTVKRSFAELRINARILKTFVLCTRKLHNNASFGSFLAMFEDLLHKQVEEVHAHSPDQWYVDIQIRDFIQISLAGEMEKWYVTMLDSTLQSTSLTTDLQVLEIITCLLENLDDHHFLGRYPQRLDPFEALGEQMIFLKTLIYFVKEGSVEVREDLLAHAESNAFKVAYLLFQYNIAKYKKERWIPMRLQISTLVLEMKPVSPLVYEIYTQALSSLNFSRQLLAPKDQDVDDGAFAVAINFLDSLVTVLSEMVQLDTCMDSMKGQRLDLFRRLVSLRTIVKKQPTSFDKKLVKSIADAVRDAGIVICSFHQTHVGTDHGLQHLLDIITIILADFEEMDVKVTVYNSPKTSSYGFVDYILEKLMELTSCEVESTAKSHIQTIQQELAFTRSSLGKVMELHEEQEEIQTLWGRLLEVAYKVESLLDHLVVGGLPDIVSTSFDTIMGDISNIKAGALKIQLKAGRSKTYNWMPSQTTPSISNEVIGFKNEERSVLDRLQRGSQQLRLIAIVGMPGQGKTTLAAKVYNHPSTSLYFSVRAWCPISQALDKKKVLCDLLKQIDPNINLEMAEHDLADKLRRCLKGKRYIIFLDDIWNLEAWNTLKDSFPNDSKGSRIIFTSRSLDASPHEMLDQEPLILSELSREESLELLQRKLFPGKGNGWPPQLHDIGMQIAEKCKGLPLSIIILAGILADTEPEGWKKILDSFSLVSSTDFCRYTLELSYKHLPDYLRPCFLYFGAFPEDQEVSVRRLLRIWIGEGFVRKPDMKRHRDDVAEDYLKQLIGRSLIMSVKQRYDGGVKTCRIHDLLREFCLQKAKDEHFFHFLKGYDELLSFNVPHSLRRLCIDSKPEHLHKSKLFCPRARSLLLNCSQQLDFHEGIVYPGESLKLQFFKLLKVLDLESINVGSEFPCAIEQLVLLSFLAIGGGYNLAIPSWIANLSVLETFIVSKLSGAITLPVTFWNMQKLKYLHVGICGILPIENLDNSSVLYELDKISGVVIHWSSVEKLLRKFPNVRCLNCKLYLEGDYADYGDKFVFPGFLSQLESLHVAVCSSIGLYVGFDFSSLTNLKKLALTSVSLYSDFFSIIGEQLPNIEVLKLCNLKFSRGKEEYTWEMKEGEFSKLRVVHLKDMHLRRWITCNDQFECFQKLVIHRCDELEELPCCLESIETLEMIEIRDCHESLENLVIQIQEKQKDWGISGMTLKIWKSKTRN